jgi:hypothetical protein
MIIYLDHVNVMDEVSGGGSVSLFRAEDQMAFKQVRLETLSETQHK